MTDQLHKAWSNLRYHPAQSRAYYAPEKFVGLLCGRGSGKSELAKRRIVRALPERKPWPNPIYAYCLPTYRQAKKVGWASLLALIPPKWLAKDGAKVSELKFETIFGSTLYVVGMDKPERIEGVQWDGVVWDEACDHKAGAFDKSLVPALSHHCQFCWRIGVPKRTGPSAPEFIAWMMSAIAGKMHNTIGLTWASGDILTPEQLEYAKKHLSKEDFDEQYNALIVNASGGVYVEFSKTLNVSNAAQYCRDLPIYVGCDFNVDPMSWVLAHYLPAQDMVLIFDELRIRNTTTQRTLNELYSKYITHRNGWVFTGDAASRQRSTTADLTDYMLINNDERFGDKGISFPNSNPGLRTRFSTVNAALCNAQNKRRVLINPGCTYLIDDLTQQAYKPGTFEVDKSNANIGHMSDAFGYLICLTLPIPYAAYSPQEIHIATGY